MRRFSQRSHLVTLSEINITPLLDLAFVLLIIFVITTPLLEKGLNLNLPKASGQPESKLDKRDIKTVDIDPRGNYVVSKQPIKLGNLLAQLAADFKANQNLVIYIRADENSATKHLAALIDGCQRAGITKYSLRTEPPGNR
ncbi:MAG: biopolymer transporter ExbD [Pedosphaera sp.]|nr:biopolymer transporter ExbD [Pedosphaera sp.]